MHVFHLPEIWTSRLELLFQRRTGPVVTVDAVWKVHIFEIGKYGDGTGQVGDTGLPCHVRHLQVLDLNGHALIISDGARELLHSLLGGIDGFPIPFKERLPFALVGQVGFPLAVMDGINANIVVPVVWISLKVDVSTCACSQNGLSCDQKAPADQGALGQVTHVAQHTSSIAH